MNTLLLPTDFSATARNAAHYALQLAEQFGIARVVLYHSYEIPISVDPMVPGVQMLEVDTLKESSQEGLERFRAEILPKAGSVVIEIYNEYGDLSDGLDDVCKQVNADLIVMGITGGGLLEEKLIGSNAVTVASHTKVPVIIVPQEAAFTRIEEVLLTSDYEREDREVPLASARLILRETNAKLFVFDIDPAPEEYEADPAQADRYALRSLLAEFSPEFHFSQSSSYADAINDFTAQHKIDLIITIARKQGFFGSLFSESHTRKLAFHSKVPVMVVHGE